LGKFRFRLSWLLIVLALVGLAPTLAVSVVAVLRTAETSKDASIAKLNDTVSPLAGAVENEISRTAEAVSRMASLPVEDLARKDLHPARTVTGIDNFGGELITEVVPNSIVLSHRGGVTPRGIPYDTLLRSTALGTPQLSNLLFVGPNKEPRIAIVAPGPETPEGRYFVTLLLSPDRLVRLLQGQGAQNSSILIAVTDGQGRLVARSKNPGPFIGKPVPDWKNLQAVKSSRGNFEGISKEGAKIVFSFVIMPDTPGWAVVVGEPFNAFTARWRQPIQDLAIGGLIALLLALAASAVLARYIVNSLKRIVHFSELVAEGTPPPDKFPEATIREFHALSLSIEQSQASLLARTELLAKSERRYRSLAEVGALVFWTQGLNGEVLTATGWRELTGEDEAEALGTGWMKRVHPEDVERLMTDRARIKDHTFVDSEFRIKCTSGNWRWVKSRGSLVADGPNGGCCATAAVWFDGCSFGSFGLVLRWFWQF
jgi:PAS domain S-box-containing protein